MIFRETFCRIVPAGTTVVPEYATADGGAIFSSAPLKNCTVLTEQCQPLSNGGTQYIFDQSGNPAVDANGNPISPGTGYGCGPLFLTLS